MGVELLAGQRAALDHALELLELRRDVNRGGVRRRRGEPFGLVDLHLGVDQSLDPLGITDVGEPLLAVLAARFDQQISGTDDPLEDALAENSRC